MGVSYAEPSDSLMRRCARRGDRTPIELLLRGAASIESHIRRLILAFIQGAPATELSRYHPGY
jgi:hypothetical protein